MTADPRRPFYKLRELRFIGPVPRADFAEFITRAFEDSGIRVGPGAVDAIIDCAQEVPYNVQLLAHECSDQRRRQRGTLTPEVVRATRDTTALCNDPIYSQLWIGLTSGQQKALVALLRERAGLLSADVSRRYDIAVPSMQKALAALEAKRIVRHEQPQGEGRLRLEDPLYGAWVDLVAAR